MSGYCAIGMTSSDSKPAIVVTIAMTVASLGRSMKIVENTLSTSGWWCRSGRSKHGRASPQRLHPLHDHLIPRLEPVIDNCIRTGLATGLYTPYRCLAIFHNKYIDALLIGNESRLRNQHLLLRLVGLDECTNKLAVDQLALWVREGGAHQDGVGRLV